MLKCVEDDKVLKKRKMAESRKLAVIYKWLWVGYLGNKHVQIQVNLISFMLRVNFNGLPLFQNNKLSVVPFEKIIIESNDFINAFSNC